MVLTVPITKYDIPKRCSNLKCENDSHCMETLVLANGNARDTEAKCICHGYFTGPRCEAKLILTPGILKAHYIGFSVLFYNVSSGNIMSDEFFPERLSYSIQYWKNASEKSCSIATNFYSPVHGLEGLESDTVFTLCAVTDPNELCIPREVNVTRDKNCIVVQTLNDDDSFLSQSFILPVAISVIIILILSIFGIICIFRRQYIRSYKVKKSKSTRKDWAKERRKEKQRENTQDFNLVKESSIEDLLLENYSSPDTSIDRRTTRQAGTSTFAPAHNQSKLPDVIEEFTTDQTINQQESSHMLQSRNSNPNL